MTEVHFETAGLPAQHVESHAINAGLDRLAARRKSTIEVVDHFARSKLAWKLAVLQEALLYRVVALGRGAAVTWNTGNFLTCILAVRALVETVALSQDLAEQVQAHIDAADLASLSKLLDQQTFATRDEEWLSEHPDTRAVNILTLLDRFDRKRLPGVRRHYDRLSERCHPNSLGHPWMFSKLDTSDGTVNFSDLTRVEADQIAIIPAALQIVFFVLVLDQWDQQVMVVAEMQDRMDPVGGRAP